MKKIYVTVQPRRGYCVLTQIICTTVHLQVHPQVGKSGTRCSSLVFYSLFPGQNCEGRCIIISHSHLASRIYVVDSQPGISYKYIYTHKREGRRVMRLPEGWHVRNSVVFAPTRHPRARSSSIWILRIRVGRILAIKGVSEYILYTHIYIIVIGCKARARALFKSDSLCIQHRTRGMHLSDLRVYLYIL